MSFKVLDSTGKEVGKFISITDMTGSFIRAYRIK